MEEKIIPHVFPFTNIKVELEKVRLLENEARSQSIDRIKKLEKRDEEKKKNDSAKNDYESLVLDFRSWLSDDGNEPYITSLERDKFIDQCNEGEDWLYSQGSNADAA